MKSEKGQSLVEFALVLPLLMMLLFGIIDFGRIFHAYLTIDHAGREAARAASVGKTYSEASQVAVKTAAGINLNKSGASVTITPPSDPAKSYPSGTDVKVTITYPIDFLTPIIGQLIGGSFNLTDTTVMRVE
ncbi:TadE/TadG family type IV pilus assembly protein [Bacillus sp. FJAT-27251]|uniref:TadE/TadG family type IV pilus assembly protein n=1 Tax=Bacillus sp. FJAT-27251 TaxID=1684142 RepID=UPI0006A75C29|nr:TadE/TadG family type IV pilus assembly protein [Bacillus sp. FJAT-27251]